MTERSRRRHAASGARWLTAGLATAGTTAMVAHLELAGRSVATDVAAADAATPAVEPAAPPTTIVTVIQVRRHVIPSGTLAAPAVAPPPARPRAATPATPVTTRQAPAPARATTRPSG